MSWRNTASRYGLLSIGIHWLVLLLFIAVYAAIELHEAYPKGSEVREALKAWHNTLGMLVLVLVLPRLAVLFSGPSPAIQPPPPPWQQVSAKALHVTLYALMIVMPLTGWLVLSASGKPVVFFGITLPALVGENRELADAMEEIHEAIGTAGYYLIGLHVAAALYHHYILRDNTLSRMLPWRK